MTNNAIVLTSHERETLRDIWLAPSELTQAQRIAQFETKVGKQAWFTHGWCRLHFGAPGGSFRAPPIVRPPEYIRERNSRKYMRYQCAATNATVPVGMNYLSDLIIRPGIQKYFRPLLLYRGNMNYGHAHRLWNLVVLMMAAECETLADGLKVLQNPAFAQLCGPVKAPTKMGLNSFFGRLWDSPDVTRVLPGMTEYVKMMGLGPSRLTPVDLESDRQFVASWRVSNHPDFDPQAEKPENGVRALYYPFMAHDPKKPDDGQKIVMLVNKMVPKFLPEGIRADACQELVVGLLSGDVPASKAHDWVIEYVRKIYRAYPQLGRPEFANAKKYLSLDHHFHQPGGEQVLYTERV